MNAKAVFPTVLLMLSVLISACAPASTGQASQPPAAGTPAGTESAADSTSESSVNGLSYPIVDTGQGLCYDDNLPIPCPSDGSEFYGQDAQYAGNQPRYVDNGDGTVTDLVTGLMWQQDPGEKVTYAEAVAGAENLTLGGYDDWRLPTIRELYSLILFDGTDVSSCVDMGTCAGIPFVDTRYFDFEYGDPNAGERTIDAQYWSSTGYMGTTMGGNATQFGVNFADGRIKGYPRESTRGGHSMLQFVRYVRGNPGYGVNDFVDNGDGTVADRATGLTWMRSDSGTGMDWSEALAYCESLDYADASDWRLPNAKELQSIVDYTRSPSATGSAAIDPLFSVSTIADERGQSNYPFYWTSTTHANADNTGRSAVYIAFGEALGYMNNAWIDVHGAGAQRSDPKSGDASTFPTGRGPQGDAIRIDNYVRCVRGGALLDPGAASTSPRTSAPSGDDQPPAGGAPGQSNQPPQEAIIACTGLSANTVCSFTARDENTINGACALIQGQLACRPAGQP